MKSRFNRETTLRRSMVLLAPCLKARGHLHEKSVLILGPGSPLRLVSLFSIALCHLTELLAIGFERGQPSHGLGIALKLTEFGGAGWAVHFGTELNTGDRTWLSQQDASRLQSGSTEELESHPVPDRNSTFSCGAQELTLGRRRSGHPHPWGRRRHAAAYGASAGEGAPPRPPLAAAGSPLQPGLTARGRSHPFWQRPWTCRRSARPIWLGPRQVKGIDAAGGLGIASGS